MDDATPSACAGDVPARHAPLSFRLINGTKVDVDVDLDGLVGDVKAVLAPLCNIPASQQRLVYSGHVLKDNQTLRSYGVVSNSTIHLVKAAANNSSTMTTSTNTGTSTSGTGLGSATSAPVVPTPQQQLLQNPEMMRQVLNSPIMQIMLDNPELMRSIMMANPEMQSVIQQNPEIGHMMNDPAFLRQAFQAAANPEIMREMQRNAERSMLYLENIPGGFNELRRMYTNIQEPLMNASMQRTAQTPVGATSNVSPTVPNTAPVPNPWAQSTHQPQQPQPQSQQQQQQQYLPPAFQMPNLFGAGAGAGLGGPFGAVSGGMGGGMGGDLPNATMMNALLDNPQMQDIMTSVMSNPELMESMMMMNPQTRTMLEANPAMRQMIRNPIFLQMMSNPQVMRNMMQMRSAMAVGQAPAAPAAAQLPAFPFLLPFTSVPSASDPLVTQTSAPPVTTAGAGNDMADYELRFAPELEAMRDMGFDDTRANITALLAAGGNVNSAIDYLLRQGAV